ncbi:NAD(P)/FAD-dependent oxidoreductase [Rubinisphaera italica]|uniref:Putative FAD-dependent oxidoreductase LodB n=1 Tax=Rubinisphaera italica TaxID=2527969 RepID=A0A5C5XJZ7_9PLAN|nr:NAD(P)/FAD-dependent oxidoreductase [Rubinisphaera italica]TWT62731.1 putative FAD-dependent oxidoreductase LodB [Rubinisphaera italica]
MIQVSPSTNCPYKNIVVEDHYDIVVLGGGPAGATCAALLAEAGKKVVLLERGLTPRFHVGESLLPKCYPTLQRLNLLDRMKNSAFPKKYSVQFVTEMGKVTRPFYFDEYIPHESSQTWQVERGNFDSILLEKAVENGTVVRTNAHVMDVLFDDKRAIGVKVKLKNDAGEDQVLEIASEIVIDASGQSAMIANRLGVKKSDPLLKKGTLWGYFENAIRDEGRDEGATLIMQTEGKKSWFWYIPLSNNIVSVGCTGSMNYMFGDSSLKPADIFARELSKCPEMQRRLEPSTQFGDFKTTKDFSYRATQTVGEGWVMIGDAFGFVDPVYSSGVLLAMVSGEMAADAIIDGYKMNDLSPKQLGRWNQEYISGLENFKKLVYAFYAPDFSFAKFFMEFPECRNHMTDILMGDVFKPGLEEIFDKMGVVLPPSDIEEMQMTSS